METITFFSYKGGAGRSSTCLNTLPYLKEQLNATKQNPILVLDMDVESAGITYLLNKEKAFASKIDIKKILLGEKQINPNGAASIFEHDLYSAFVPVGNELGLDDNESVLLLGVDDSNPLERKDLTGLLNNTIEQMKKFAHRNNCSAIVMDSAAGDQPTARLAVPASSKVVLCLRPTKQFRIGTFNYLKRENSRTFRKRENREIILLPTIVPKDSMIDGELQIENACLDMTHRIKELEKLNINTTFVNKTDLGICEVDRFKWKEGLLYRLDNLTGDEIKANESYKKLAEVIKGE